MASYWSTIVDEIKLCSLWIIIMYVSTRFVFLCKHNQTTSMGDLFVLPPRKSNTVKVDGRNSYTVQSEIKLSTTNTPNSPDGTVMNLPPRLSTNKRPKIDPVPIRSFSSVPNYPQRKTWDYNNIDRLARSAEIYEKKFGETLQTWLGSDFKVQPHENKFHRHDLIVSRVGYPTKHIKIELECGVTQTQWVSALHENRAKWVQGLNVISRKIVEGQHFTLFIKHNMACNSFFAATYDFIKKNGIVKKQAQNSLGFKTDNVIYSIPWTFVVDSSNIHPEFCFDNASHLKDQIQRLFTTE